MSGRFPIEDVSPAVSCGRYPAKAVVDELVPVSARAYREGHNALGCNVVWHGPDGATRPFTRMRPGEPGQDRWHATIRPDAVGEWTFTVEAFQDPYLTWHNAVTKKVAAGQGAAELANDLAEGVRVLTAALPLVPAAEAGRLTAAVAALGDQQADLARRVAPALDLADLLWAHPVRELVTTGTPHRLWVDRPRALFSAWYEFFPRSEGAVPATVDTPASSGTFATAVDRLPGVAAMGFDVLYLPPIHPIGRVNRKGRNNALTAGPDDVGSPWAIGAAEGGHDAIHPDLGTPADFRAFVAAAAEQGLEVALDLALQCAPDHPWVTEHPEWFTTRADGSIAYAENPPKKYQDIYPVNFDNDPDGIRAEVLRVVRHWIGEGIRIFRVDNPHTKPFDFWHWLIAEVKRTDPDVLFLAEAFTRPAIMHGLGKIGFTQSYTYFTWRTTAAQMREYCEELVASVDWMRPNFWPNTPDILHESLQHGGPPMFKIRAVLAALLSPSLGHLRRLRTVRARRPPRRGGISRQREVRAAPPGLGRRAGARSLAGPVRRHPQPGTPRAPGPAPAAQPGLPRHRQPGAALLVQARPGHRRHRHRGLLVRLAHRAVGQHHPGHAGARLRLARTVHRARRADRGRLRVGPAQRGPARPVPATRSCPDGPSPAGTGRCDAGRRGTGRVDRGGRARRPLRRHRTDRARPGGRPVARPRREPHRRDRPQNQERPDQDRPDPARQYSDRPRLEGRQMDQLIAGATHDPHALLGAHPADGWTTIRTMRRGAGDVVLHVGDDRHPMKRVHDVGVFEARIEGSVLDYRVEVDGVGHRRPVPSPADPGRAGPAPDRRGPARAALGGARRAGPRRRRRLLGVGAQRPWGAGDRRLRRLGAGRRLADALSRAPAASGRSSCPARRRAARYKYRDPRRRRAVAGQGRPAGRVRRGPAGHRLGGAPVPLRVVRRTSGWSAGPAGSRTGSR